MTLDRLKELLAAAEADEAFTRSRATYQLRSLVRPIADELVKSQAALLKQTHEREFTAQSHACHCGACAYCLGDVALRMDGLEERIKG